MNKPSFFVVDTEGNPILKEVALINEFGQVIYEAYTPESEHSSNPSIIKPLIEILGELRDLTRGSVIVAHNSQHDQMVLKKSCQSVGLAYPNWTFFCTYKKAKSTFHDSEGFSLEALCHQLELGPDRYIADHAHTAVYDAQYTYYLYRRLQLEELRDSLKSQPNPFSSSRVDTPFQSFEDARDIYGTQYQKLKSVLSEIEKDPNQQSRGVVLLGDPGSGKTHLMMRLAQDVIKSNRVLFIRQPTNVNSVFYHIYARILESLVQTADEAGNTQLDLLLMQSIRTILEAIPETDRTQKDHEILAALDSGTLEKLGRESSAVKRERWLRIEKHVLDWWSRHFSLAGHRGQILQGLLRYCRYTDPKRREVCRRWLSTGEITEKESEQFELTAWGDRTNREEFSLQAIQVFGDFSTLDSPLILVFDQLEGLWQAVNEPILLKFGEVIKELFTHVANSLIIVTLFPDRWQQFQEQFDGSITERLAQYVLSLDRPSSEQLESIINSRLSTVGLTTLKVFTQEDLSIILNQHSVRHCLNRANEYYAFRIKDELLPPKIETFSTTPRSLESGIEQRISLLERQLNELTTLVKSLAQPQLQQNSTKPTSIVQALDKVENLSLVNADCYGDDFQRYLATQMESTYLRYSKPQFIDEDDDIGKLRQICDAFKKIKSLETSEMRLGRKKVPVNILLKDRTSQRCLVFIQRLNMGSVFGKLVNLNELVKHHPKIEFILIRDQSLRPIDSEKASYQLACFENARTHSPNTHYLKLKLERRVQFELVYKLVTDINNRDLDFSLSEALSLLVQRQPDNWIVRLVAKAKDI